MLPGMLAYLSLSLSLFLKEFEAAGDDNKVSLIWKHQLMQFNNLSINMAAAIVAVYPSPAHLLQVHNSIVSIYAVTQSSFVGL